MVPRDICSSCRACEAAFGGEAVVNSGHAVHQIDRAFWFYDGSAAERSLAQLGSCYRAVRQTRP
jgi:hypothetical protein